MDRRSRRPGCMVLLASPDVMPSAGTSPRDPHASYPLTMGTPPATLSSQSPNHQWDINDSTLPLVSPISSSILFSSEATQQCLAALKKKIDRSMSNCLVICLLIYVPVYLYSIYLCIFYMSTLFLYISIGCRLCVHIHVMYSCVQFFVCPLFVSHTRITKQYIWATMQRRSASVCVAARAFVYVRTCI